MSGTDAGWYRDPTGRYDSRYWDGQQWSTQANSGGVNSTDEPPSEMLSVPPAPGTQSVPPSTPPPVEVTQAAPRSSLGIVAAVVLGVVAIIAVVGFLISQTGGDGGSDPASEPTATTPASEPSEPSEPSEDGG